MKIKPKCRMQDETEKSHMGKMTSSPHLFRSTATNGAVLILVCQMMRYFCCFYSTFLIKSTTQIDESALQAAHELQRLRVLVCFDAHIAIFCWNILSSVIKQKYFEARQSIQIALLNGKCEGNVFLRVRSVRVCSHGDFFYGPNPVEIISGYWEGQLFNWRWAINSLSTFQLEPFLENFK